MAIKVSVETYMEQTLLSYMDVIEQLNELGCISPFSFSEFRTVWRQIHKNSDILYNPNKSLKFDYIAFDDESYLTFWLLKYSF